MPFPPRIRGVMIDVNDPVSNLISRVTRQHLPFFGTTDIKIYGKYATSIRKSALKIPDCRGVSCRDEVNRSPGESIFKLAPDTIPFIVLRCGHAKIPRSLAS
jgi:hypothetical protein